MTARLDIRLPANLKHNLALEAARDNRTVSAVTVLAIREYLNRRKTFVSKSGDVAQEISMDDLKRLWDSLPPHL